MDSGSAGRIHDVLQAQITVAQAMGVGLMALRSSERGEARTAFARQTAMYLCHLAFGMSCRDVARAFRRERTTVGHAVRRVEEAREDPELDRTLQWLEASLRGAADA